ncbi:STAS domain-containing protein [Streptomyces sp. cmx-4-9]|uniref:STAS domain-containing protein n=1 Tax=Streptomyces sp. cmx-4-9 TaxID=2790941 RepID=UPI00397EA3E2
MAEQSSPAEGACGASVSVIRVAGDLDQDAASTRRLDASLGQAVSRAEEPTEIVVDVSGLTFCDSTGLNVLLRGRVAAASQGHTIRLVAPNPQLVRLLQRTGSISLFTLSPASPTT